jgi:chromosome segregation ATPase
MCVRIALSVVLISGIAGCDDDNPEILSLQERLTQLETRFQSQIDGCSCQGEISSLATSMDAMKADVDEIAGTTGELFVKARNELNLLINQLESLRSAADDCGAAIESHSIAIERIEHENVNAIEEIRAMQDRVMAIERMLIKKKGKRSNRQGAN